MTYYDDLGTAAMGIADNGLSELGGWDDRMLTEMRITDALVTAVGKAHWPDGSLLVDLDDVVRTLLAPHMVAALEAATSSRE
jgi:hypothetical protein